MLFNVSRRKFFAHCDNSFFAITSGLLLCNILLILTMTLTEICCDLFSPGIELHCYS